MPGPSSGAFVDQAGTAPTTVLPDNTPGAPTAGAFAGLVAGPTTPPAVIAVVVDSPTVAIALVVPAVLSINASVGSPTVLIIMDQPAVTMAVSAVVNSPTVDIAMNPNFIAISVVENSPTVLITEGGNLTSQDVTALTSQDLTTLSSVN